MSDDLYMPPDHERVWRALRHCRGRDAAVPHTRMAQILGLGERQYRKVVQDLKLQWGKPIGTRFGAGGGYYLITNEEERRESVSGLLRHAVSCFRGAYRLDRAAARETLQQLELDLQ